MNRRDLFRTVGVGALGLTGLSTGAGATLPMRHHVDKLYELYVDTASLEALYVKNDRKPANGEIIDSKYMADLTVKMNRLLDYSSAHFDPEDLKDPEIFQQGRDIVTRGWAERPNGPPQREYLHTIPPILVPLVLVRSLVAIEQIHFNAKDTDSFVTFTDTYQSIILAD